MTSTSGDTLLENFQNGAFVGLHGAWNRKPYSGNKVIFVPFVDGRPSGKPVDVTGFLTPDGEARGRPVGVEIDRRGALLVADDVGNVVWRLAPSSRFARELRAEPARQFDTFVSCRLLPDHEMPAAR